MSDHITLPFFKRDLNMLLRNGTSQSGHAVDTAWCQSQSKSEAGPGPDFEGSTRRSVLIGLAATTLLILLAHGAVHGHHSRSRRRLVPIKWDAARVSGGSGHGPHRIGADRPSCLDAGLRYTAKDL
jgi:hypothetical protein